jgi:hypothetical protein
MSTKKQRSASATDESPKKGYRIVCTIDRIEEFDMKEDDTPVVLVTTAAIGSIDASCDMNIQKGNRKISLRGVDNVVILPDPSVKVFATKVKGTINMTL